MPVLNIMFISESPRPTEVPKRSLLGKRVFFLNVNMLQNLKDANLAIWAFVYPNFGRTGEKRAPSAYFLFSRADNSRLCYPFTRLYCCSVPKLCPILCDPRDCNMPGFPVFHCLPEFAQTHVPWVSDAQLPVGDFWSRLLSAYLFLLQILLFGLPFLSLPIPGINPFPPRLPGLQVLSIQLHPTPHWRLGFRIPSAPS